MTQSLGPFTFPGQFPLTAPDLAVSSSDGGMIVDIDALATETLSELQNLTQDLTNRLVEMPGSNLDFGFGSPNTRGVGIMSYLSGTTQQLAGLPKRIDAEFEQDPRVTQSYTKLTTRADGAYLISTQLTTVAGVFGLAWAWSQAGVVPVPT